MSTSLRYFFRPCLPFRYRFPLLSFFFFALKTSRMVFSPHCFAVRVVRRSVVFSDHLAPFHFIALIRFRSASSSRVCDLEKPLCK